MKATIIRYKGGNNDIVVISLRLEGENEQATVAQALDEVEQGRVTDSDEKACISNHDSVSFYAEPGKVIYGIPAEGIEDGRVMEGPNGELPKLTINIF